MLGFELCCLTGFATSLVKAAADSLPAADKPAAVAGAATGAVPPDAAEAALGRIGRGMPV